MHVRLRTPQWRVFQNAARFRVLAAGRRFGKTYLALTELCRAAWGPARVAWVALKKMTRDYWSVRPNESELRIELITGGRIALCGADNYDALRGDGLDFVVLDEYASMASQAW